MSYPGSNILNQALRVIAKQCFKYYAFMTREKNAIGYDVNTYAPPIDLQGSVQPVPRNMYEQYGLQLDKRYITVWTPNNIIDISRNRSSDQVVFKGGAYQSISNVAPWFPVDGWTASIFVEIPHVG